MQCSQLCPAPARNAIRSGLLRFFAQSALSITCTSRRFALSVEVKASHITSRLVQVPADDEAGNYQGYHVNGTTADAISIATDPKQGLCSAIGLDPVLCIILGKGSAVGCAAQTPPSLNPHLLSPCTSVASPSSSPLHHVLPALQLRYSAVSLMQVI